MESNQQLQNVQEQENRLPANLRTGLSSTQQRFFSLPKARTDESESLDSLSGRIKAMLVPMTVILAIPAQPNDIEISILAHYLKETTIANLRRGCYCAKMNASNQFPKKKLSIMGSFQVVYFRCNLPISRPYKDSNSLKVKRNHG